LKSNLQNANKKIEDLEHELESLRNELRDVKSNTVKPKPHPIINDNGENNIDNNGVFIF
jgi:hypothetical protein